MLITSVAIVFLGAVSSTLRFARKRLKHEVDPLLGVAQLVAEPGDQGTVLVQVGYVPALHGYAATSMGPAPECVGPVVYLLSYMRAVNTSVPDSVCQ
ncbi:MULTISPECIES: hypothetical protein [Streptomyces]|uniref:Uncharacterized protein n=1 Tax=Streptomyces anulatus TaxID=1892 RepID=A0ABZ1ZSQ2_STRAQ|nr:MULTISPECIES: hypothetical protein [Streptomyces]MBT1105677.1 hypothetical protein [Streptomyces sp. Tu10]